MTSNNSIPQNDTAVKSQYMQDSGKVLQEHDTNKNTADVGGVEKNQIFINEQQVIYRKCK